MKVVRTWFLGLIACCTVMTLAASTASAQLPMKVTFEYSKVIFSPSHEGDSDIVLMGLIENTTESPLLISFRRSQSAWYGWGTSICFGSSCFSQEIDTAEAIFEPHEAREFVIHVFSPPNTVDSAHVYLKLYAGDKAADTLGLSLTAIATGPDPMAYLPYRMRPLNYKIWDPGPQSPLGIQISNHSDEAQSFTIHTSLQKPADWEGYMSYNDETISGADTVVTIPGRSAGTVAFMADIPVQSSLKQNMTLTATVKPMAPGVPSYTMSVTSGPEPAFASVKPAPSKLDRLSIYPNPATVGSVVSITGAARETVIVDALGREVAKATLDAGHFNVPQLPSGGYFVVVPGKGVAPLVIE